MIDLIDEFIILMVLWDVRSFYNAIKEHLIIIGFFFCYSNWILYILWYIAWFQTKLLLVLILTYFTCIFLFDSYFRQNLIFETMSLILVIIVFIEINSNFFFEINGVIQALFTSSILCH